MKVPVAECDLGDAKEKRRDCKREPERGGGRRGRERAGDERNVEEEARAVDIRVREKDPQRQAICEPRRSGQS